MNGSKLTAGYEGNPEFTKDARMTIAVVGRTPVFPVDDVWSLLGIDHCDTDRPIFSFFSADRWLDRPSPLVNLADGFLTEMDPLFAVPSLFDTLPLVGWLGNIPNAVACFRVIGEFHDSFTAAGCCHWLSGACSTFWADSSLLSGVIDGS